MDIWGSFGVRGGSRPYLFPPEPPRRPTEGRPQALHGAVGGRHGAAGAAAAQSHGEEDAGVAPYGAAPQRPTLVAQRPISARRLGGGAQRAAIHWLLWGGDKRGGRGGVPCGPIKPHRVLQGTVWPHTAPCGSVWSCMAQYGSVWFYLAPYGPMWSYMAPYGSIWFCMVP